MGNNNNLLKLSSGLKNRLEVKITSKCPLRQALKSTMTVIYKKNSPHGPQGIICVHDGVDRVIYRHIPPLAGIKVIKDVHSINQHCQMMEPATKIFDVSLLFGRGWVKLKQLPFSQACWNYQWRKMSFCFRRMMKKVSTSSRSFDMTKSVVQYPVMLSSRIYLKHKSVTIR